MHHLILISFRSQSNLFFFPGDFGFLPLAAVLELIWKLRTSLRTCLTRRHNVQSHGARCSSGHSEDSSVSSGSCTAHTALFSPHFGLFSEEQNTKWLISNIFFFFPLSFDCSSHFTGEKASTVLWKFCWAGEVMRSWFQGRRQLHGKQPSLPSLIHSLPQVTV